MTCGREHCAIVRDLSSEKSVKLYLFSQIICIKHQPTSYMYMCAVCGSIRQSSCSMH